MSTSEINQKRLISTFCELVRIDSLSFQERKIIDRLTKELEKMGYSPREIGRPARSEAGNLVVEIQGKGKTCLMVNAHVDTVSPGKGIEPIEKNGYIVPKGKTILGADNKAGVAVMLETLKVLKEKKIAHPHLLFIFTVAEEVGLSGAKSLPGKTIRADCAVVLDGGDINEIIVQAPSSDSLTAIIYGKAAHAGLRPEEGISAIKAASEAVHKMKLGRIDQETTANIGIIKGGEATNIVPDRAEIHGEARSHTPAKLKRQIARMSKILKQASKKHRTKLDLKISSIYHSFKLKPTEPIVKAAIQAVKSCGLKPVLKRTGGGSDANVFNQCGIPSVIMGVGMDQVHTTNERVKIRDMVKSAEILLQIIKELCDD
jgi:tripeptide aminopeptidase